MYDSIQKVFFNMQKLLLNIQKVFFEMYKVFLDMQVLNLIITRSQRTSAKV
jgi:hypothetical protein